MTMLDLESLTTHRRGFLGRVAAGAAAVGLGGLFAPLRAAAEPLAARRDASASPDFEAWLNKMTGKHKMVFDVPRSEEHTSELQSRLHLVCRLLLEKKKPPRDEIDSSYSTTPRRAA